MFRESYRFIGKHKDYQRTPEMGGNEMNDARELTKEELDALMRHDVFIARIVRENVVDDIDSGCVDSSCPPEIKEALEKHDAELLANHEACTIAMRDGFLVRLEREKAEAKAAAFDECQRLLIAQGSDQSLAASRVIGAWRDDELRAAALGGKRRK